MELCQRLEVHHLGKESQAPHTNTVELKFYYCTKMYT